MSKYILGKKVGMTQVFDESGLLIPVTVVQAGPCAVVQVKTPENDGYSALGIAFEDVKEKRVNKPLLGFYKKAGVSPKRFLREWRTDNTADYTLGKEIKCADMFQEGDRIDITGTSKGKGYQGVIKRHGHSRGRESHGSKFHRAPGSLGANSSPSRVFKNKKLPGHMGSEQVTVKNLRVVKADNENNVLIVKGAVPGPKGGLLIIKETTKS
ncbi:MAG TPA: 50S ribosomal protein L3 [Clostridiales bacterium]|nr:50S ribosomal protein L3 [Clostridiales bacterium]